MSKRWLQLLCVIACSGLIAQPAIYVEGLFKGGAILNIDGQQKLLRQGQTSSTGVTVVEATAKHVVIEFDGRRQTLNLSRHIGGSTTGPEVPEVKVIRNSRNRYITYASINGRRITVLVDTGATIVAMSSVDAGKLGINYRRGVRSKVVTASGVASAYSLVLDTVALGNITVSGVQASVIEGEFPDTVLLGMSYLSAVDMQEKNGVMTLRRKY